MASFASNMFGGGGFGAFSKSLNSFIHPEEAYKDAANVSQQYYLDAQGKLQPIANQGQDQYGFLMNARNRLNDPVGLENEWSNSYSMSPEAKQDIANATAAGQNSASSQGLVGSSALTNNIQHSAGDIMSRDRQQFLTNLMQKYMAGIGIGSNIYGLGANADSALSTNAMNEGNTMAGLKYGETAAPGALFGNLLGKAADAGVNYATGGMSGAAKAAGGGG